MKDFLNKELNIGDVVAVAPKNYRGLVRAKIKAFTPQQVRLEYFNHVKRLEEYLTYPNQIIKI